MSGNEAAIERVAASLIYGSIMIPIIGVEQKIHINKAREITKSRSKNYPIDIECRYNELPNFEKLKYFRFVGLRAKSYAET